MDIRPYAPRDLAACLALFDSNLGRFFAPEERADFELFLQSPPGHYLVMEHEGEVVGCGGYAFDDTGETASLTWGIIRRDLHGNGLGRFLLMYRLREIGKRGTVSRVRLITTPNVCGFFEKQGFRVTNTARLITMEKKLTVCA